MLRPCCSPPFLLDFFSVLTKGPPDFVPAATCIYGMRAGCKDEGGTSCDCDIESGSVPLYEKSG